MQLWGFRCHVHGDGTLQNGGGVNVKYDAEKGLKRWFIAENVQFDSVYPQNITIFNEVHITRGCTFLTHHLDTKNPDKEDIH